MEKERGTQRLNNLPAISQPVSSRGRIPAQEAPESTVITALNISLVEIQPLIWIAAVVYWATGDNAKSPLPTPTSQPPFPRLWNGDKLLGQALNRAGMIVPPTFQQRDEKGLGLWRQNQGGVFPRRSHEKSGTWDQNRLWQPLALAIKLLSFVKLDLYMTDQTQLLYLTDKKTGPELI